MIIKKDKIVKQADDEGWRVLKMLATLEGRSIADMIAKLAKEYAEKIGIKSK